MKKLSLVKLLLGSALALCHLTLGDFPTIAQVSASTSSKSSLMRAEATLIKAKEQYDRGRLSRQSNQSLQTYLDAIESRNKQMILFYGSNGREYELEILRYSVDAARNKYNRINILSEEGAIAYIEVLSALDSYQQALKTQWQFILVNARDRSSSPQKAKLADLELRLADAQQRYERMSQLANEGAISINSIAESKKTYQTLKQERDRLLQKL